MSLVSHIILVNQNHSMHTLIHNLTCVIARPQSGFVKVMKKNEKFTFFLWHSINFKYREIHASICQQNNEKYNLSAK